MSTALEGAVSNAAIGITTVVALLLFLSFVIWVFGKINIWVTKIGRPDFREERKPREKEKEPENVIASADVPDDNEIAAVIAAAIAAAQADEPAAAGTGYYVSSVRRIRTSENRWKRG